MYNRKPMKSNDPRLQRDLDAMQAVMASGFPNDRSILLGGKHAGKADRHAGRQASKRRRAIKGQGTIHQRTQASTHAISRSILWYPLELQVARRQALDLNQASRRR